MRESRHGRSLLLEPVYTTTERSGRRMRNLELSPSLTAEITDIVFGPLQERAPSPCDVLVIFGGSHPGPWETAARACHGGLANAIVAAGGTNQEAHRRLHGHTARRQSPRSSGPNWSVLACPRTESSPKRAPPTALRVSCSPRRQSTSPAFRPCWQSARAAPWAGSAGPCAGTCRGRWKWCPVHSMPACGVTPRSSPGTTGRSSNTFVPLRLEKCGRSISYGYTGEIEPLDHVSLELQHLLPSEGHQECA